MNPRPSRRRRLPAGAACGQAAPRLRFGQSRRSGAGRCRCRRGRGSLRPPSSARRSHGTVDVARCGPRAGAAGRPATADPDCEPRIGPAGQGIDVTRGDHLRLRRPDLLAAYGRARHAIGSSLRPRLWIDTTRARSGEKQLCCNAAMRSVRPRALEFPRRPVDATCAPVVVRPRLSVGIMNRKCGIKEDAHV